MDDQTLERLMRELKWLRENAAFIREGVVTDDSPLTIALGGVDLVANPDAVHPSVTRLASYTPTTNDRVSVLVKGNSLLVLGEKV